MLREDLIDAILAVTEKKPHRKKPPKAKTGIGGAANVRAKSDELEQERLKAALAEQLARSLGGGSGRFFGAVGKEVGGAFAERGKDVYEQLRHPLREPERGTIERDQDDFGQFLLGPSLYARSQGRPASGRDAAIDALLFPFLFVGPLRGVQAAARLATGKGGRAAVGALRYQGPGPLRAGARKLKPPRTLRYNEKVQPIPSARSPITRMVIEKPADIISHRFPGAPIVGAGTRVARAGGRIRAARPGQARAPLLQHFKVLAKQDEASDAAHFVWAQLPAKWRNVAGLRQYTWRLTKELKEITQGDVVPKLQTRVADLSQKLGTAKIPAEKAAFAERIENIQTLAADLPNVADDIASTIKQLDALIANPPKLNPRVIRAMQAIEQDSTRELLRMGLLTKEEATARRSLFSSWLNVEPTGEEIYVPHLLAREFKGGALGNVPIRAELGKVPLPKSVIDKNRLVLASQGRLRMSSRATVEHWEDTQRYIEALKIQKDLGKMGKPFAGSRPEDVPADSVLLNPEGLRVLRQWRGTHLETDKEILDAAKKLTDEFFAEGGVKIAAMLDSARQGRVSLDSLRVVKKKDVARYYGQFVSPRDTGLPLQVWDAVVDFTAMSVVFGRVGYIPKNVVQNVIMAVPHQGVFVLANGPRAAQLIPRPGASEVDRVLWDVLANEAGGGSTEAIMREARFGPRLDTTSHGAASRVAGAVIGIADTPPRISAVLHELSAEGIIARYKPYFTEEEKAALLAWYRDPANRELADVIKARANESMADFTHMTPIQRRRARRLFVIPGWLVAGTRYPFWFIGNYPLRSAALAWVAAGEPGAPKQFQVNKPIDEYFAKGLPYWVEGVETPLGIMRTSSISPVTTPIDLGLTLAAQKGRRPFDIANPALAAGIDVARSQISTPEVSFNVPFHKALIAGVERITPNVRLIEDLISLPSDPRWYPEDTSRIGRLKRELGVLPIEITRTEKKKTAKRPSGRKPVTSDEYRHWQPESAPGGGDEYQYWGTP